VYDAIDFLQAKLMKVAVFSSESYDREFLDAASAGTDHQLVYLEPLSLHCPLTSESYHLIDAAAIATLKPGAMLINTSRGPLIDTRAVIDGIKSGQIGHLGIDVYEEEQNLFFRDLSDTIIQDDTFQLLQSFPNVVITAHQAFFTRNALEDIARTTIASFSEFEQGQPLTQSVSLPKVTA
jgi:D-lactate dehydrogenase